ncbi:hypothetical protein NA57DRAFT_74097 [Rhizodiscina lignyota]|uniref:Zn(2)-C6 fungal-type domain-containing protein n=1 Tax=Rhizodiscina lignyota TaxID=1504668 RepID=A0A9P4IF98_9PEZI|nr:hypothetical protein NA57DRAFT_74097 [Rhizodiscina lignyota]
MVGVPGRSKACNTCRRRKIACSLERPHCFQCIKSGRQCLGYQKERVFVTSAPSSEPYATSWRPDAYSKTTEEPQRPVAAAHTAAVVPLVKPIAVPRNESLEKSAIRQSVLSTFLSSRLHQAAKSGARAISWIAMIPDLPQTTQALEMAAFAVCTARIARSSLFDVDDRLVHESLKLYGQGLQATRRALSDPKLMWKDEVLVACVLLGLYEVFECPSNSRSGYLSHFDGCAKLIQLRGPHAHKHGIAHSIFLAFRTMGALESLIRKNTYLSRPSWKTIPFSAIPKSPFDRVIDIYLEAPAMFALADELVKITSPYEQFKKATNLAELSWDLDRALNEFYDDLKASANGPLYWPVFSTTSEKVKDLEREEEPDIFPVQYEFIDGRVGGTVMFYWAICLIHHSGMCQLYKLLDELRPLVIAAMKESEDSGGENETIKLEQPPLEHRKDFVEIARNICQGVEFCIQDDLGQSVVTSPLNIVINILCQWPGLYDREIEWARRALDRLEQRGVAIVKYLPQHTPVGEGRPSLEEEWEQLSPAQKQGRAEWDSAFGEW